MIVYKNITLHRGDKEAIRIDYPGDISHHNLTFVLKKDRELTSQRLLQISRDNAVDNGKFSALYDGIKKITQITIIPGSDDTQDLSGNFVFDIYDSTDVVTRIDGNIYIEPDVQTPFDGTNLPADGKRYLPYYPGNFNDKEILQYDSGLNEFKGKAPGNLSDENFYSKSEINESLSSKVDKVPGKVLSTNDFTDGLKNQFDSNNQLKASGIKDANITFSKLSFLKTGKNLFNSATMQIGRYVDFNTGIIYPNSSYTCSDYISIIEGQNYSSNILHFAAFYNSSKQFISGINNLPTNRFKRFTAPLSAAYIIFDFPSSSNNVQLELGDSSTSYESFCKYLDSESLIKLRTQFLASCVVDDSTVQLTDDVLSIKSVPANLVTKGIGASQFNFIITGKNLFNKLTEIINCYISSEDGLNYSSIAYNRSDFISVLPNSLYTCNYLRFVSFFTSEKVFISGISYLSNLDLPKNFTTPTNTYYVIISYPNNLVNIQLESGNLSTTFESFRYIINTENSIPIYNKYLDLTNYINENTLQLLNGLLTIKNVSANLLSFIKTGKNLYNKANENVGYYISWNEGFVALGDGSYNCSDFIEIMGSTSYSLNHVRMLAYYDANKKFISGLDNGTNNNAISFITPTNANFIRFCYLQTNPTIQLELGQVSTKYEPFRYIINSDSSIPIYAQNIDLKNSIDNSTFQISNESLEIINVPLNALEFIISGKNLLNMLTQTLGHYSSYLTGELFANPNYNCSDYIAVYPFEQYSCNYIRMVTFYDSNKIFLSGVNFNGSGNTPGNFFTTADSFYCKISYSSSVTNVQLEYGAYCTPYQSFRYIIDQQNSIPIFIKNVDESGYILPRLILPSKIFVATGREMNLWYNAITYEIDGDKRIYCKCLASFGLDLQDCFRYYPTCVEEKGLTIQAYNSELNTVTCAKTSIQSVLNTAGSGSKQILFIGDSFINQNMLVNEIRNLIETDGGVTPILLGTRGTSPNLHEGRGGWSFGKYINNSNDGIYNNPFWDILINDNNFKKYMTTNGFSGNIDFCILYLGLNDIIDITYNGDASEVNLNAIIANAKALIDDILSNEYGFPNCKIILIFPTFFPIDRTSWAENYQDITGNLIDLRGKRNMFLFYEKLVNNFDNGVYNANVSICASAFWMDRSSKTQSFRVLSRNRSMRDSTQESYVSDFHPNIIGYNYLADAIYSHLRALFN